MSFPNIPDINPYINLKLEDSINLLLISIALEEISLSKLMDAETDKILFVLDECSNKDSALQDAIAVNKSVDNTLKNMIKLQMLLQFKLENVTELLPSTTTTSTTTTTTTSTTTTTTKTTTSTTTTTKTTTTKTTTTKSTSTTTTTHTTTCTTSTCSTTTKGKCDCGCGLIGKGMGSISNQSDRFYSRPVVLQAFVFSYDYNNRSLRYSVYDDVDILCMVAIPSSIIIECPLKDDSLIIRGKGRIENKSKCNKNIVGTVNFILKVRYKTLGKNGFHIIITSKDKLELNHDSGFVQTKNSNLGLRIV